jgi:hypothetical protein
MDITLLQLYNPFLKMSIKLSRSNRKYKLSKQITPVRNIWVDDVYEDLSQVKGILLGELINGFEIKMNNMGMDFLDELVEPINKAIEEDEKLKIKQSEEEDVIEEELSDAIKKGLEWS